MEISQSYYIHNNKIYNSKSFNSELLDSGISIYEVVRIENGISLFLEDHLARLYTSSEISSLNINEGYCDFESLIEQVIKENNVTKGKIKIVVRFNSEYPRSETDVLIYFTPHNFPDNELSEAGIKVGICPATRENPNAKVLNTNARIKADKLLSESDFFEVLLSNEKEYITEGSKSNVFFISNNKVITPPLSDVLNGITRKNIIKLCKENSIDFSEEKIAMDDIERMESAFLSGTSLNILPIVEINNKTFNIKHSLLLKLKDLYKDLIENYISKKLP